MKNRALSLLVLAAMHQRSGATERSAHALLEASTDPSLVTLVRDVRASVQRASLRRVNAEIAPLDSGATANDDLREEPSENGERTVQEGSIDDDLELMGLGGGDDLTFADEVTASDELDGFDPSDDADEEDIDADESAPTNYPSHETSAASRVSRETARYMRALQNASAIRAAKKTAAKKPAAKKAPAKKPAPKKPAMKK